MRAIFTSGGAVLVISAAAFFAYDIYSFRQASVRQLSTLGDVIASNSTAALAFANVEDATTMLSALKADPSVTAAALYDTDGQIFATYPENLDHARLPAQPLEQGHEFDG